MRNPNWPVMAAVVTLTHLVAGCGGGGEIVASTPPPIAAPTPPPTPSPKPTMIAAPTTPLQAPRLTAAPSEPLARAGGPTLKTTTLATSFPLLMTVVTDNFSGDQVSTAAGGSIRMEGGKDNFAYRLTSNNPALSLADDPGGAATERANGLRLSNDVSGFADLDYLRYGYWAVGKYDEAFSWVQQAAAGWIAGYATEPGDIPLTGTAQYSGDVALFGGLYFYSCQCQDALTGLGQRTGRFSLTANFASRSLQGRMTELKVYDSFPFPYPIRDVDFTASYPVGQNTFSGSTRFADGYGSAGDISGRFFGPGASEIGAVFTLPEAPLFNGNRIFGSFGGKRQ